MRLGTEHSGHFHPHFSSVVHKNELDLDYCLPLSFTILGRIDLTAGTVALSLLSYRWQRPVQLRRL